MVTMTLIHEYDYVRYACRAFIEGHEGSVGCSPSGVMFNKFMTLLYRDVRRTLGVDIRLPYCWYRWGRRWCVMGCLTFYGTTTLRA